MRGSPAVLLSLLVVSSAPPALAKSTISEYAPLPPIVVRPPRYDDAPGQHRFFESDRAGRSRELAFRGVNVVYKDPPWYPNLVHFHANVSFVDDDIFLLKSLGVNLVRLGVMWPGVFPTNGREVDENYVTVLKFLIDKLARAGIYTLLDPHQDEMNPLLCGEGAPDWFLRESLERSELDMIRS